MKYISMILFFAFMLVVFMGMHYYTLARVLGFFMKIDKLWIYALILALLFPIATIIDKFAHSPPTIALYSLSSTILGITFLTACLLLICEIINIFHPVFGKALYGIILLLAVFILTIISLISAHHLNVKEVNINNFGKDLNVVQLSDVHVGTIKNTAFLNRIVEKTNSLNPDIVVITGDLLDGTGKLNLSVLEPLNNINSPVYVVMGNHEFYEGEDKVIKMLNRTNVTVLRNSAETIKGVQLVGLDYSNNKTYVKEHLQKIKINSSSPSILLNHEPIGYNYAKEKGIKLQLSGHTHAGQIFPFTLLIPIEFPKYRGLYTFDGNFSLYVSSGTGTWGPPMRLGSTGEITLLHLKK